MKVHKITKDGKPVWNIDCVVKGQRVRASSTKSRQDCIEKYEKRLAEIEQEEETKRARQKRIRTLKSSMTEWYDRYRGTANGYSRSTTAGNNAILKAICDSFLGGMRVCEIGRDDIQDWILSMDRYSYSTRKNRFCMLRQYFESEYSSEPGKNPCLGLKVPRDRSRKEKMLVLTDKQMKTLVTELSKPRNQHSKSDPGYTNGGALIVLMYQFLRIGELCGLRKRDIDINDMIMHVTSQRSYGKDDRETSGSREVSAPKYDSIRDLPIFPPAEPWIRAAYEKCTGPDDYLFRGVYGNPLTPHPVRNTLNIALERTGLPHIRLHDLRHTGISFLLRHGVPIESVSAWAGHSSISITQDIYYTVVKDQLDDGRRKAMEIWEEDSDI